MTLLKLQKLSSYQEVNTRTFSVFFKKKKPNTHTHTPFFRVNLLLNTPSIHKSYSHHRSVESPCTGLPSSQFPQAASISESAWDLWRRETFRVERSPAVPQKCRRPGFSQRWLCRDTYSWWLKADAPGSPATNALYTRAELLRPQSTEGSEWQERAGRRHWEQSPRARRLGGPGRRAAPGRRGKTRRKSPGKEMVGSSKGQASHGEDASFD